MTASSELFRVDETRGEIAARRAAAESHRRAGDAHDRAARTHRRAAAEGIGDVDTHLQAVAVHEAARDHDYRAAESEEQKACSE